MDQKTKYLLSEFWALSWNGSVQRAYLYRKGCEEKHRIEFRRRFIDWIDEQVIPRYRETVSAATHESHILELCEKGTQMDTDNIFESDGYHLASAQKLLNLQLKYLWCLGEVVEPPHCPVDRVILNRTSMRDSAWTKMRRIEEYRAFIEAIRERASAERKSIAQWELDSYDRSEA
jgi:hypothetical protein